MNLHEYAMYLAMNEEGGGGIKNPVLELTIQSQQVRADIVTYPNSENGTGIQFNTLSPGETAKYNTCALWSEIDNAYIFLVDLFGNGYVITENSMENCTVSNDAILITDPTKGAKANITLSQTA